MQRKKQMRQEAGSVAVVVTATLLSFYIILIGLYVRASFVRRSQLMADLALKSYYEIEVVRLIEQAKNQGFGWTMAGSSYSNGVAKVKISATDNINPITSYLQTNNIFNGSFKIGYINDKGEVEKDNETHKNAVYTDLIYVDKTMFKCVGPNDTNNIVWVSYDINGKYISSQTGEIYRKPTSGAKYYRILFPNGLTVAESEKILVYSTYEGDRRPATYVKPSSNVKAFIGDIDITDKAGITVYITNRNIRKKEYTIEIRDIPERGDLRVVIAEKTVCREVNGQKEFNFERNLTTGIKVSIVPDK